MNKFEAFIKDKPQCFGSRQTAGSDSQCGSCSHIQVCKAAVWGVLHAVKLGDLPADGYFPSELQAYRDQHRAECQGHGLSDIRCAYVAKNIPTEVIKLLHNRVLQPRSPEEIQAAREWEDWDVDLEMPPAMRFEPTHKNHSAETSPSSPSDTTMLPSASGSAVKVMPKPEPALPPKPSALMSLTYRFPIPAGRPYEHRTNEELAADLKLLIDQAFHAMPALGYGVVRNEFCAIHIEMNLRQQYAPRFRPMHPMKKDFHTEEQKSESRDRQVIDLHWRAHSSNKPVSPAYNYPTIFNTMPFDVAAAERFAQEEWGPQAKAIHLHLTEDMQWENAILQSNKIRLRWRAIAHGSVGEKNVVKQRGAPHIEQELREAIDRNKTNQVAASVRGMVDAWSAREIVGNAPAKIGRMISLMTGSKPRDRRAVKRTLDSLDRHLGKKQPASKKPVGSGICA